VAATWTPGQSLRIYFNGEEVASRTDVTTQTALFVGTAPLWIGHQFNTSPGSTFEGLIDEAAVYDRALSAAEILEHFQAATGAFVGTYDWSAIGSGDWNLPDNWDPMSVPNSDMASVNFGSTTSPQTVTLETDVTTKSIQVNSANKFAIAGHGTVVLSGDTGSASISVTQGNHEFQAPVRLGSNTNVNVAAGSISFNNVLDLNGDVLDIQSGTVNIRHLVIPGAGGMVSNAAVLSADGGAVIGGDLSSSGVLEFDIAGAGMGQYDSIDVTGTATLSGSVHANLVDGYRPSAGESFTLLTAGSLIDNGITLTGPFAHRMQLQFVGNRLVLEAVAIPEPATLILLVVFVPAIARLRHHRRLCLSSNHL
jgi:hypothetical protein